MSHHTLGAFFSGQDIKTLQVEGNDTNCFVSLIVDTRGTYKAAVTRKIQNKIEVITKPLNISYEFFGEGEKEIGKDEGAETKRIISKDTIEYFMLDVEREEVNNPFQYLDERFEQIEEKKKSYKPITPSSIVTYPKTYNDNKEKDDIDYDWYDNDTFHEYLHQKEAAKEPTLWDEATMKEMEVPISNYTPDPKEVEKAVAVILSGSTFVTMDKESLKSWANLRMEDMYKGFFLDENSFEEWRDFIVDYVIVRMEGMLDPKYAEYDYEEYHDGIVLAILEEMEQYKNCNSFVQDYIKALEKQLL